MGEDFVVELPIEARDLRLLRIVLWYTLLHNTLEEDERLRVLKLYDQIGEVLDEN